jgi:hypothetical protein
MKSLRHLFGILLVGGLLFLLVGCSKSDYPRPTREYYVNDYANMWTSSLKHFLIHENNRLYEDVDDDGNEVGAQVVFASFVAKNEAEEANYRGVGGVDIFNQWRIGKDDLGVLVLFIYREVGEGEIATKELSGLPVIITGRQMAIYFTASEIDQVLATAMTTDYPFEIQVMQLFCEILNILYVKLYDYGSFTYTMEELEDLYYNYTGDDYGSSLEMEILYYLFSGYSSLEEKLWGIIPVALVFLFSGGLAITRGGGGSSGGTGFFRRRR